MTQTEPPFLPYGRHDIDEDDVAAVVEVLRGGWLTTGPKVEQFERKLADRVGARFAVSCSSGTAGLHLACLAAGMGEGDTVIVPALTFLATANAPHLTGAEVAFADTDPDTALMTGAHFREALERAEADAKAVLPVHYAGQCADLAEIKNIADENDLMVVEDACHALGADYDADGETGIPVGACRHSHMSVFSFHPVKAVAMGEGGAVTTNDPELYERLIRFRNHGMVKNPQAFRERALAFASDGSPNPWYYEMPEVGLNYRASDINCALALSQLGKLDRFIARRRQLSERYDQLLAPLAPLVAPLSRATGCRSAFHLYPVLIDFARAGRDRANVMERLTNAGIGTQVHYLPVHLQPYYADRYGELSLAGAETFYRQTLSLPLFPAMADKDVDRVVAALVDALEYR